MSTTFELSRVYADGWNVASALTMEQRDAMTGESGLAALNPWPAAKTAEHARWAEGFSRALGEEKKTPFRPSLLVRRHR